MHLVLVPRARAERARVVLAEVPEALEQATRIQLAPWSLRVISIAASLPSDRDRAMQHARELAAQHQAGAVVWLTSSPDGHALWLYDAHQRRLISQPLAVGPPLDEAGAASVALSIKTLLRHTPVAPKDERFPSNAGSVKPNSGSIKTNNLETDNRNGAGDSGDSGDSGTGAKEAGAVSLPSSYNVEARIQMRSTHLVQREIGPRFGIGLAWWPRALDHRYGLAVHFEGGPEPPVKTEELRTHFRDMALSVALRRRIQVRGRIYAVADGGVSLHFTKLEGVFVAGPGRIDQHETNPSLDIGLHLGIPLLKDDNVDLAIRAFASTRWQGHIVDGVSVMETPVLDLGMGAGFNVKLH